MTAPVQRPAEGWRLVPVVLEYEMASAMIASLGPDDDRPTGLVVLDLWQAAIAAAPPQPAPDEGMVEAMARAHNKAWREFRKWDEVEPWPAYCDAKDAAAMRAALALYLPPAPPSDASNALGAWMSAALDDQRVCDEMKAAIRAWFAAGQPAPRSPAGQAEPAGWRPIETAPESGSFLVWCPEYHNIYVVYCNRWTELEWPFAHFGPGADLLRESATHWHTLPTPPSEPGQ